MTRHGALVSHVITVGCWAKTFWSLIPMRCLPASVIFGQAIEEYFKLLNLVGIGATGNNVAVGELLARVAFTKVGQEFR